MESALPSELLNLIAQYTDTIDLRLISTRFKVLFDKARVDNDSIRTVLFMSGDFFSLIVRFGDQIRHKKTQQEIEYIQFYMTYRTKNRVASDVINNSCFRVKYTEQCAARLTKCVLQDMNTHCVTIPLDRFTTNTIHQILLYIEYDFTKFSWLLREIDKYVNNPLNQLTDDNVHELAHRFYYGSKYNNQEDSVIGVNIASKIMTRLRL